MLIALVVATVGGYQAGASAAPAIPALSSQASPSGYPVGVAVYDTATLGFGVNPTGTITFSLFDLDDAVCGEAPIFTSNVAVTGNTNYTSASFRIDVAGTYRWVAQYGGDANNKPAMSLCSNSGAAVTVGKRMPTLTGDASTVDGAGAVTNTAVLNGGGPNGPTGSITFRLFGAGNQVCSGEPVFTSVRPVAGSGSYTSDPYRPTAGGSHQWLVSYGGDANNTGNGTSCTDPANTVQVSGGTALTATPGAARGAEMVSVSWSGISGPTSTDWVGLAPAGANTAVKVWKYTNGASSGSLTLRVPSGTVGGNYEVRLMANGTTTRLATIPVKIL